MHDVTISFHQERPIDAAGVRQLYTSVGWWSQRREQEIVEVLESDLAIGAWDGNRLIGFARVISDHHFHAYIDDVVVHPDYQKAGVGSALLVRLLEALKHIETITLFCHHGLVPFYEHLGFKVYSSQVLMHHKGSTS